MTLVKASWIVNVPKAEQADALKRCEAKAVARDQRRVALIQWNRAKKDKAAGVTKELFEAGYSLHYFTLFGYRITLAYRFVDQARTLQVIFTTCSHTDQYSKVEARKRLLYRATIHRTHKFESQVDPEKFTRSQLPFILRHRFIEYAVLKGKGLPHSLVGLCQIPVEAWWDIAIEHLES